MDESNYQNWMAALDLLIVVVGEDECRPYAGCIDFLEDIIEKHETSTVPEML